jgi:uncharacterized repeat protein (TIGR03843 family)
VRPDKRDALRLLATAPMSLRGQILSASNITILADVGDVAAVYKPAAGERPLWDFPPDTLHRREVAAFVVSDFLGWDLVPPTVLRDDGPLGVGSVQLFIDHDPRRHYFVLADAEAHAEILTRMAVFDLLVNNADRKASHVLLAADGHIWGCDHGLTFHAQPKLRTVIWEFNGSPLLPQWCEDLGRLVAALDASDSSLSVALTPLLEPRERLVLRRRAEALVRLGALPDVAEDDRGYPWPPL